MARTSICVAGRRHGDGRRRAGGAWEASIERGLPPKPIVGSFTPVEDVLKRLRRDLMKVGATPEATAQLRSRKDLVEGKSPRDRRLFDQELSDAVALIAEKPTIFAVTIKLAATGKYVASSWKRTACHLSTSSTTSRNSSRSVSTWAPVQDCRQGCSRDPSRWFFRRGVDALRSRRFPRLAASPIKANEPPLNLACGGADSGCLWHLSERTPGESLGLRFEPTAAAFRFAR